MFNLSLMPFGRQLGGNSSSSDHFGKFF